MRRQQRIPYSFSYYPLNPDSEQNTIGNGYLSKKIGDFLTMNPLSRMPDKDRIIVVDLEAIAKNRYIVYNWGNSSEEFIWGYKPNSRDIIAEDLAAKRVHTLKRPLEDIDDLDGCIEGYMKREKMLERLHEIVAPEKSQNYIEFLENVKEILDVWNRYAKQANQTQASYDKINEEMSQALELAGKKGYDAARKQILPILEWAVKNELTAEISDSGALALNLVLPAQNANNNLNQLIKRTTRFRTT